MAKHNSFTVATNVKVYFCDPQSPWQRGTNKNTNVLLRQYFPKRSDLYGYTQAELDQVSDRGRNNVAIVLEILVVLLEATQGASEIARDTRLFGDDQRL